MWLAILVVLRAAPETVRAGIAMHLAPDEHPVATGACDWVGPGESACEAVCRHRHDGDCAATGRHATNTSVVKTPRAMNMFVSSSAGARYVIPSTVAWLCRVV